MSISVKRIDPIEISTTLLVLIKNMQTHKGPMSLTINCEIRCCFRFLTFAKLKMLPKCQDCGRLEMAWLEPAIAWLGIS